MKEFTAFSFGAGVQSTTILLMICKGELPKPDLIVFADTGWEPQEVYKHLKWCIDFTSEYQLEIQIVNNGNLREDILLGKNGKRFPSLPFFTKGVHPIFEEDVEQDENQLTLFDLEINKEKSPIRFEMRKGMVRRQCTNEYKIMPVKKAIRKFAGLKHGEKAKNLIVNLWMGISIDEIQRMKQSTDSYIKNIYPLIDMNMSRSDCFMWLEKNKFPIPPKSSCIGCPFHDDYTWGKMKINDPKSFDDAVIIDNEIRKLPRFNAQAFLHRSCKPLSEIEFSNNQMELNDFINECTGHCGV